MDWGSILGLALTAAAVAVPFVLILKRDLKNASHLKSIIQNIGITDLRSKWMGFGASVRGQWNEMPVLISIGLPRGESHTKMILIKTEIDISHPGRLYLRNRARPMIYDWPQRPLHHWKLPAERALENQEDNALFVSNTDQPEMVNRLLSTIASRKLIFQNLIDADSELILEAGKLKVLRLTRTNWNFTKEATRQQLEKMLREQWDLLRTIVAVLQPLHLQVSDRSAATLECPFCKNELDELLSLVKCSACQTYHHQSCWMEHGRCSVYGCNGLPSPVVKTSVYNSATE